MGWRDGQGGWMMQPQSSLSGFRGGANPLAGTGGVRSPAGPYGPPGFIDGGPASPRLLTQPGTGMMPTGGLEPYNPGMASTTGGVGTTMQPNGSAPTNGPRLPPIPPGTDPFIAQNWGFLHSRPSGPQVGTPEWFASPQGLQQGVDLTQRLTRGMGPGTLGTGGMGGQHPAMAANAGMGGRSGAGLGTAKLDWRAAGQPNPMMTDPAYRMQEVLAGRAAPGTNAELQAMLAQMSPADRDAYVAKYRSIGLDPLFQGGGGSGPFGNGIAS